jgi:carboxyl-terminal processing protease
MLTDKTTSAMLNVHYSGPRQAGWLLRWRLILKRLNLATFLVFIAITLIFMCFAYFAGFAMAGTGGESTLGLRDEIRQQLSRIRKDSLLNKAMRLLDSHYYMEISDTDKIALQYAALRGMMNELREPPFNDSFSHFYDPELYSDLEAQTTGEYAGIGVLMGLTSDGFYPEIVVVFPNTPAEEIGLQEQDVITAVDGEETFGLILPEVATRIKGEPGSIVKLSIYRPADNDITDFEIERREVEISSIPEVEMHDGGVGYIKISNFAETTGADFRNAMDELMAQGMTSLVIDLNNNSGGLLSAAVDVADCFVKEGLIVEVVYRDDVMQSEKMEAEPSSEKYELPIVVLINEGTASASEVLTGALRDHGLARIIGEQSFGKGVVQSVTPLETEWVEVESANGKVYKEEQIKSALAITIGKYFTPEHYDIHDVGIEPDIWYEIQNMLAEDPHLRDLQAQMEAKRDELNELRREVQDYLRANEMEKRYALDIAYRLGQGEEVEDVPQLEMENSHRISAQNGNGKAELEENAVQEEQ